MKLLRFLISKVFLINLAIALVITVLASYGVVKFLHSYTNQAQKIEVPDLAELTLDEVKVVLDDLQLRSEVLDAGAYQPEIPKGAVLEQEPSPGQIVKEKRKIYITVNPQGYAMTSIPDFYGKTKKEIEQIIANSGFIIGEYEEIEDIGTVVRGLKYKEQPLETGDKLPKMSVIDIVIGNGLNSKPVEADSLQVAPVANEN
ncbi:PASTA domain-containing protein [Wenyingzhuangia sp. 2_MG-2023]|uniref:PASTA domain-containing protein n=1 Tax=Wenyingzhuangia sp. 2_MG-2023 TaxID=3062639 RepID=UPI0026E29047|nr:PASTA domain-containing protein [Wenyingzhuangia sp. 2_MG-2023]MDO6737191.1 PASTA domain-containing protein [Wenyingzhuangia sp. 2_MG-2023]MDO6801731.1 PASTA domain-containing protein [Wenyingzhuangia sp. 1_MG-2023]